MARIMGVEIPDQKKILYALPYIYGIGHAKAKEVLKLANIDPEVYSKDLNEGDLNRISQVIDKNYRVEGNLRREVRDNIKRLQDIGAYRGLRHKKGLPVRGQRTRHNARTRKGRRKTIGGISTSARRAVEKT